MVIPTLSEIYIYPVKSCSGIKVQEWDVTEKGLRYDRQWMVIDRNNKFVTQRQQPRMSLIETSIVEDLLTLSAPKMNDISLPTYNTKGKLLETTIWQDQCIAQHVGKEVDQWLSEFLQIDCRLVYQTDETIRLVDQAYASATDKIAFTDGFPFLIITENSLSALNQEMEIKLPMSRFRPNLVISGCNSYAEDFWRTIDIGTISFRFPKPCSRCSMTTVNNQSATFGKEPLKTLNRLRKWNNSVYFGQNALHDQPGILKTGDLVKITQVGKSQPGAIQKG